jgi:hypothetical protein
MKIFEISGKDLNEKNGIKELNEINTEIDEGKLLIMALSKLTCTIYHDKTPNEVIEILNDMSKRCKF